MSNVDKSMAVNNLEIHKRVKSQQVEGHVPGHVGCGMAVNTSSEPAQIELSFDI